MPWKSVAVSSLIVVMRLNVKGKDLFDALNGSIVGLV